MIKTILLTGATGFIGSFLLPELLKERYKVIIVKRLTSDTWRIQDYLDQVQIYTIEEGLERPFKEHRIDYVIHLATHYVKWNENLNDVQKMIDCNIAMTVQLCQLSAEHNVHHFLNTGTMFEYKQKNTPLKEDDERQPYNLFSATKIISDDMVRYYTFFNKHFKVIDLKLFSPFGEKDHPKVLVFLTQSLINNKEIDFSGGEQRWNFTYVKDIVEAYLCALRYFSTMIGYESFNIGYDQAYSLKECVAILEKIAGRKLAIRFGAKPYVDHEIFYVNCDPAKAKKKLGWKPKYNLASGLRCMYNYYKMLNPII